MQPLDVEVTRARVEGREVLAGRADSPAGPATGLLLGPVGLAAAVGGTAWFGASPDGLGWAGVAATVGCLVCARAWVRTERRTARVDVLVRHRFVAATDVAASLAASAPSAPPPTRAAPHPARATPAGRLGWVPGRTTAKTVLDRVGSGTTLLAGVVALALVLVLVAAVAVLVERPGPLTALAPLGPLVLLGTHLRLLVVRASTPVVGTGLLARWADAALLRRDLRLRLTGTAATPALYLLAWHRLPAGPSWASSVTREPALYLLAWHRLPGWWFTLAVVAAGLLLAVQVALLLGLDGDGGLLPRAAPRAAAELPTDAAAEQPTGRLQESAP